MTTPYPGLDSESFRFSHETAASDTLLRGFSQFGLAGLTAADYLVDHLELEQTGYVAADDLPAITPFENGTPRHHTRLFSRDDFDVTVLVGELFVPVSAADPFTSALADWLDASDVGEVAVLAGVPMPHAPTTTGRTTSPPRTTSRPGSATTPTWSRWATGSSTA